MGIVNLIKANIIIAEIKKQDPESLGIKLADMLDKMLDDSCANVSEEIQGVIVPFINRLSMALTKRLLEDQKGGQ